MDTATVLFIIAIVGCLIGILSYTNRRDNKTISDAIWKGEINGKLDAILGINIRIDKVECDVQKHGERIAKVESKADSAHHRLDDHLTKDLT